MFAVVGISVFASLILNANAQDAPVKSIEITSTQTDYAANEQGAWKITKSAEWTGTGTARITFSVKSRAKYDTSKQYDILLVTDNSASMDGKKLLQVKTDAARLVNSLSTDERNRVAIVSFSTDATIRTGFTNDKTELVNQINNIPLGGQTNYYKGLLKAEEVLEGYVEQADRRLILLFLTDGCPNEDIANGVAQYEILKAKYPNMTVSGIQYEMGDEVLQPIIDISDDQYIADMDTLNNVLFDATIQPYAYEDFVITDYIDTHYWSVADINAISTTTGTATLEDDHGTPKITWDMSGLYRAGQTATMTIEIDLNSEYLTMQDVLLPTNTHETVVTSLGDLPAENIDSNLTPILSDRYTVTYDANQPSDCTAVVGTVPEPQKYTISTVVEVVNTPLTCEGYVFQGWSSPVSGDNYINNDFFRMPGEDVTIRAIWGKPSISKSLDGTIKTNTLAILDYGEPVNAKLKVLAGHEGAEMETVDENITAIKRSPSIPSNVDLNNSKYNIAHQISPLPVYVWYDNGTIYYYSDAEIIYYYGDARGMFYSMTNLSDISGLSDISAEYLYDPEYMFFNTPNLTDFSVLSSWQTPRLRSLYYMFSYSGISNLEPLSGWSTSGVYDMSYLFYGASNITNINALSEWSTDNVQDMSYMFSNATSLTNIDGAENWNVSKVTNMSNMFNGASSLSNISGASDWTTGAVTDMNHMFSGTTNLTSTAALQNWDVSKVANMSWMFSGSGITEINGTSTWQTGNVTNMGYMFQNASSLANVDGAENWDVSKVTNMSTMFFGTKNLANVDGLSKWKTTSLQDMYYTFYGASSLTDVDGLLDWDVSNVTTMVGLFGGNTNLADISGLRKWQTDNVTTMSSMFTYDYALSDLTPLANWHTQNVTNMTWMFALDSNIQSLDGLQNWNVSKVTDFASTFYSLSNITTVNEVSAWTPTSATTMSWMFGNDTSITDLNTLEGWNVSSSVDITSIFNGIPSTVARPTWANGE